MEIGAYLSFLVYLGSAKRRTFQEEEMSDPYLRNLFFQTLLEWSQQFLDLDSPSFLEGSAFYLSRFFLSFCSLVFGSLCILPVYVGCAPCFGVLSIQFVFVYQKKYIFASLKKNKQKKKKNTETSKSNPLGSFT